MLNVDEQMLDYGAFVADQFRNASMICKGYGIQKRAAEVNAVDAGVSGSYSGGGYRYGRYGYYEGSWNRGMTRSEQQSAQSGIRTNLKASGAASVQQIRSGYRRRDRDDPPRDDGEVQDRVLDRVSRFVGNLLVCGVSSPRTIESYCATRPERTPTSLPRG